jgi:Protein of unknown function (DUF1822)
MNTNKLDISKLIKTYSEHEWIDLTEYPEYTIDDDTTPVNINLHCKDIIKEWLETNKGLISAEDFPYSGEPDRDRLVSQLVNGFCLKINNGDGIISKVVFIPGEQIDIDSFEIAQEWVDLSNWLGDYYVPIQVDVETQHLHLWGMITHQDLKQMEEPDDEMFRYYNVDADRMVDNLEVLWTSCELAPEPRSNNIPKLVTQGVTSLIDRVKSEAGSNFDRLILAFEQWGAILNDRSGYLEQYLTYEVQTLVTTSPNQLVGSLIVLSRWFNKQINEIQRDWQSIPEFLVSYTDLQKSQPLTDYVFLKSNKKVDPNKIIDFYESQNSNDKIDLPLDINSPQLLLRYLMKNTIDENLRWKVAEYLWEIDPANNEDCQRRMKNLELAIPGCKLGLMVAIIPLPTQRYSILNRVYPIGNQKYLPPNVKIALLSKDNQQLEQIKSQENGKDSWIQIYFPFGSGKHFNISVSINDSVVTELFEI